MKGISDIDKLGLIRPTNPGAEQVEGDGDLFRKTFEQALAGSGAQPQTAAPSVTGLGEIQALGPRFDPVDGQSLEQNTDRLLTLLDQYSEALNDPGQSLRDMEPILKNIKTEAETLTDALKIGPADEKLKAVAEESALLANVEYVKFMRGDYL